MWRSFWSGLYDVPTFLIHIFISCISSHPVNNDNESITIYLHTHGTPSSVRKESVTVVGIYNSNNNNIITNIMAAIQEVPLYPVFPPNLATRAAVRCTQGRQIGGGGAPGSASDHHGLCMNIIFFTPTHVPGSLRL